MTSKPQVITKQTAMIDRLEKELEISGLRERELREDINNMEEEMYRSKNEINKRKKTLMDLESMEMQALETGDKLEAEKLRNTQNIIKSSFVLESNTKCLHNKKKNFFLIWREKANRQKAHELLLSNVLTRATQH